MTDNHRSTSKRPHDPFVLEDAAPYIAPTDGPKLVNKHRHRFVILDDPVLVHAPALGANAFIVYAVLKRCMNQQREAWPSWKRLQALTGLGRNALRKALRMLEKWQFIASVQGRNGGAFSSNVYILNDLYEWKPPDKVSHRVTITDDPKLDVQFLDGQNLVNNLDPDLRSRSRSELDPQEREKAQNAQSVTPSTPSPGVLRSLSSGKFSVEFLEFWKAYASSPADRLPVQRRGKQDCWRWWQAEVMPYQTINDGENIRYMHIQRHLAAYQQSAEWHDGIRMTPWKWLTTTDFDEAPATPAQDWQAKLDAAHAALENEGEISYGGKLTYDIHDS